jgi:hypothetical protein
VFKELKRETYIVPSFFLNQEVFTTRRISIAFPFDKKSCLVAEMGIRDVPGLPTGHRTAQLPDRTFARARAAPNVLTQALKQWIPRTSSVRFTRRLAVAARVIGPE